MRQFLFLVILLASLSASSQISRDTVLSRCPVYITDTVSVNNFFLEARPATLKVYRVNLFYWHQCITANKSMI